MPITPFIGVRISWLMFATKVDLSSDAFCASASACPSAASCSWRSTRDASARKERSIAMSANAPSDSMSANSAGPKNGAYGLFQMSSVPVRICTRCTPLGLASSGALARTRMLSSASTAPVVAITSPVFVTSAAPRAATSLAARGKNNAVNSFGSSARTIAPIAFRIASSSGRRQMPSSHDGGASPTKNSNAEASVIDCVTSVRESDGLRTKPPISSDPFMAPTAIASVRMRRRATLASAPLPPQSRTATNANRIVHSTKNASR